VSLIRLKDPGPLQRPATVVALDSWVDAGSASTTAADLLAEGGEIIGRFDGDGLIDYRARRPTLEIVDGKPTELSWSELTLTIRRHGGRDVLVLTGPEPDFRWQELTRELVKLARRLDIEQWISLGAIPAAVPHTRPVPVLGTESQPGLLRGDVGAGPSGVLRVPSAAISVIDIAIADAGIPTVGYYAQVPHYVTGAYPGAALELLRAVGRHLDVDVPTGSLQQDADHLRERLNVAAAADDQTRDYVERLESMVDESRLPSGDELISEIERFLREGGSGQGQGRPN
jgi:hypothetical protein